MSIRHPVWMAMHSLRLLAVLLVLGAAPATACTGGVGSGGGSGFTNYPQPTPDPSWTPVSTADTSNAVASVTTGASASSSPRLMVLQRHAVPIEVWDDALVDLSKKMPFTKLEDSAAMAVAARWGITDLPAALLCDSAGNGIASITAPVSATKLKELISHYASEETALEADVNREYARARTAATAHHIATALAILTDIARYRGFAICQSAEDLQQTLLMNGKEAVNDAKGLADATQAKSTLRAVVREYRGTPVEAEAREVLRSMP